MFKDVELRRWRGPAEREEKRESEEQGVSVCGKVDNR